MDDFLGTYPATLDEKGRLNIPAKHRVVLDDHYGPQLVIIVSKDEDIKKEYLTVFPNTEWQTQRDYLRNLNPFEEGDRKKKRNTAKKAVKCEMKSGKILIPQNLREAAGLNENKDVYVIGSFESFEIWAANRHEEAENFEESA